MGGKDGCKGKLEAATDILYLFHQLSFFMKKSYEILKSDVCGNLV